MRRVKLFTTVGFLFSFVFFMGIIHISVNAAETDNCQNEQMNLIQSGMTVIPNENYSFDKENAEQISVYFSSDEDMAKKQQEAVLARANDNETLQERKEACAKALYNGMIALQKRIDVAGFALNREEFKEVISDVVNSNPELFYIGKKYSISVFNLSDTDNTQIVDYCVGFYKLQDENNEPLRDEIKKMVETVEDKRDAILSTILVSGMNDLEKMMLIHNYIILNTEYDYSNYLTYMQTGDGSVFDDSVYNIYGSLINGVAVCQGYSLAYKYLLEAAGVSDIGFASNDTHVWNTVTLNDESYYVDCTWDDPNWDTLGNVKYKYFMKNEEDLSNHEIKDTDRECAGTAYSDMFWNDVDSGIFYYSGAYYYIGEDGNLYKTKLRSSADIAAGSIKIADLELDKTDSWNYNNGAKLALAGDCILYHDSKNIYVYNLKDGKKGLLYSPNLSENELIYGLSYQSGTFLYATRTQTVSAGGTAYNNMEQTKYSFTLPEELFYVPVQSINISGTDTIHLTMENGNLVSEKVDLKAVVLPENATNKMIQKWTSSDSSIAVVDINGRVKGIAPGTVTITAKSYDEGVIGSCQIKVVLEGAIVNDNGDMLYYDEGNILTEQFYQIDGKTCYLGKDGVKVTGWYTINGKQYYFTKDGTYLTGWQEVGGKCYYFDENGIMLTGWQEAKGIRYYFDKNGVMLTGWQTIGGKQYYFRTTGDMVSGWQEIDAKQYYFDEKGVMQTGWKTIKKKKYYFNSKGVMQTGWKTIKKKKYYFNSKGVMQTGWKTIKKKKYYFNSKGVMQTGWKTIKKKKYYFNSKGVMQTGWKTIKKKKYYFNKNGIMVKGLQNIKGISYYFAEDGHLIS